MISPSGDDTEDLQSNGNVSSVTVSSSRTSSGANTGKQKMKTSSMQNRGSGALIGQSVYITQRKLKLRGSLIQIKHFYFQEHPATASTLSIISPHSPQTGLSSDSSCDSTFVLTQHSTSSQESNE